MGSKCPILREAEGFSGQCSSCPGGIFALSIGQESKVSWEHPGRPGQLLLQDAELPSLADTWIPLTPFSGKKIFEPRRKIRSVRCCLWLCCCSCPAFCWWEAPVLLLTSTLTHCAVLPALSHAGRSVQEFPPR